MKCQAYLLNIMAPTLKFVKTVFCLFMGPLSLSYTTHGPYVWEFFELELGVADIIRILSCQLQHVENIFRGFNMHALILRVSTFHWVY
jgi:hypothetical protein